MSKEKKLFKLKNFTARTWRKVLDKITSGFAKPFI